MHCRTGCSSGPCSSLPPKQALKVPRHLRVEARGAGLVTAPTPARLVSCPAPAALPQVKKSDANLCLGIVGRDELIDAPLQVWSGCNGGDNQLFGFESNGDGSYRVRVKHSRLCVDLTDWSSTGTGVQLEQWECRDVPSQRFQLWPLPARPGEWCFGYGVV